MLTIFTANGGMNAVYLRSNERYVSLTLFVVWPPSTMCWYRCFRVILVTLPMVVVLGHLAQPLYCWTPLVTSLAVDMVCGTDEYASDHKFPGKP